MACTTGTRRRLLSALRIRVPPFRVPPFLGVAGIAVLAPLLTPACAREPAPPRRPPAPAADAPLEAVPLPAVRGRWILDAAGKAVPPRAFERGLQTSGLTFWKGKLWSVGDQRSEFPGHLFEIDPATARIAGAPIRIEAGGGGDGDTRGAAAARLARYRAIRNPDLEGVTVHPRRPNTLLAVTEDKAPWVLEIAIDRAGGGSRRARIAAMSDVEFPDGLGPYRGDSNYRLEGIAASGARGAVYIVYERSGDGVPVLFRFPLDQVASGVLRPAVVPVDFARVPRRRDKARARLNLNGIDLVPWKGREVLIAAARDQERVLVIDPEAGKVLRVVDIRFRSPDGEPVLWVSPEGIAADPAADRLWIVNDPDSIRGNYRRRSSGAARDRFAELAPMLFELRLSAVLGEAPHDEPKTRR